jgi:hypothetical protein
MNLFEIPFAPGADLRFALLIDFVSSSMVRGESKSIFSASDSFAFCISGLFKISAPRNELIDSSLT